MYEGHWLVQFTFSKVPELVLRSLGNATSKKVNNKWYILTEELLSNLTEAWQNAVKINGKSRITTESYRY